jgi:hypothetical protein
VPAGHLAALLDLLAFESHSAKEANKERGFSGEGQFNCFSGMESQAGEDPVQKMPFFVDEPSWHKPEWVYPAGSFFARVRGGIIATEALGTFEESGDAPLACDKEQSLLTQPSAENPFDLEAESRKSTRHDQLGAPSLFWHETRMHLFQHATACQKKRQGVAGQAGRKTKPGSNEKLPEEELAAQRQSFAGPIRRLQAEIRYTNQRAGNLRKAIGRYLLRAVVYDLLQFRPATFAYESLNVSAEGKTGFLCKAKWLLTATGHELPVFSSVRAANTSKYHYGCGGVVNRHASANFGVCSRCKKIVDCHLNAGQEIAARHPNFTQEGGPPQSPPSKK